MNFDGFDWDQANSSKVGHRVDLKDVEQLFRNEPITLDDKLHSHSEARFIAMGEVNNRVIFAAFTLRQKGPLLLIRVISARFVHSFGVERDFYEQEKKIHKKS